MSKLDQLQSLAKDVLSDKDLMKQLWISSLSESDFTLIKQGLYRVAHYDFLCKGVQNER